MPNPQITLFFRSPRSKPQIPDDFSQLYLLRRDIDTCFAIDADTGTPTRGTRIIFPGVMSILAGIDLLGKFFAGSDASGQSGARFKQFLVQYFSSSEDKAEQVYQLRNSLLHSFGLYSETSKGKIYKFTLFGNQPQLITVSSNNVDFIVNVDILYSEFALAVNNYFDDLSDTSNPNQSKLEGNFMKMFNKHGLIRIS